MQRGFNMLWMFSRGPHGTPAPVDLKELDFIAQEGFNFIRVPLDYRFWTDDFDYFHPDEGKLRLIDTYVHYCRERGLHICLNLHRAPGYCINRPQIEKHNLWTDDEALQGFIFLWRMFAERYKNISSDELSFDLVNEPSELLPTHPCTRDDHERVIRKTVSAILNIDPHRQIVIDGFHGGHAPLPELSDLGIEHHVIHSGRGYMPFPLTHHRAEWITASSASPELPDWPYQSGDCLWDIHALRQFYAGWIDLNRKGVPVHIGEFGCYRYTPNQVALRWFKDLFTVFSENRWGYSLWNFKGPFGIIEHGRPGTVYEDYKGYKIDRTLLEMMKGNF